jgi:hypothetical protein
MKFIWEKTDIVVGRKFRKSTATEVFIIGYLSGNDTSKFFTTVSLLDGMVNFARGLSIDELIELLNNTQMVPVELLTL